MLSSVLFAFALAGQQTPVVAPQVPTGKSLIEKMLTRYSSAKTLEGTIKLTQSARGVSVSTLTTVAYERPSRLLVVQKQGGSSPKKSMIVSNGDKFFYSRPDRLMTQNDYLGEAVQPEGRPPQSVGDLYAIVAGELPDRSAILDLFIARVEDMKFVTNQFASFNYVGKVQLGGRAVHEIKGSWRERGFDNTLIRSAVGDFELYLTDDGDIVRYVLTQNYAVPNENGLPGLASDAIEVVNTWDATVIVNDAIKPETFALKVR